MEETLTTKKLEEMMREMKRLMPDPVPSLYNDIYGGFLIKENPYMTETETYTETVQLTWRERLWEPLKHGATMPFEPWVKTREVTRTRQVPMKKAFVMGGTLFCHPVMKSEICRVIGDITV